MVDKDVVLLLTIAYQQQLDGVLRIPTFTYPQRVKCRFRCRVLRAVLRPVIVPQHINCYVIILFDHRNLNFIVLRR